MYKNLFYSSVFAILLVACGGGGGTSNSSSNTNGSTNGIAVDPYIIGATFFWDKNKNGVHDSNEPLSSTSDENGKFSFNVEIPNGERVVMKDKGTHNGVPYTGQLSANLGKEGVVSPLTTLEVEHPNTNIITLLAEANITISLEDIHKDPMDPNNRKTDLTVATLAVDTFLKTQNINNTNTTLKNIAVLTKELLENNISDESISDVVKVTDRLVKKMKQDNNLSELDYMNANETYRKNIKKTLSKMTPKEADSIEKLSEDGLQVASTKNKILDNKEFSFSSTPTLNESTTLTLNITDDLTTTQISWSVLEQPSSSDLQLTKSSDQKSVTFTPQKVGMYTIKATATNNDGTTFKTTSFTIKPILTLDTSKVRSISTSSNENEKIGTIENQSWVSSKSLNEEQLTHLINQPKYLALTKIGYDTSRGLLIEYSPSNSVTEILEMLKLESGVDKVYNRVYAGDNAYQTHTIYPNDYGDFNSSTRNWHLKVTHMPEAWDYTQGSDKFLMGVSDAGYDTQNDDLTGRFAAILTNARHNHGMGVVGSMAAIKNNSQKIAGINDISKVVASFMGGQYVEQVITTTRDSKDVKLINNSWGFHLPSNFNPTSASVANKRFQDMQAVYAQIRQLVAHYDNKIFVWAAGNGVGNGLSSSGYYGVDAKYENGSLHYKDNALKKLNNLLVVGAFKQDKVLTYYSAYGQSVDIAAPTSYASLTLNNGTTTSFGGTSAAAPVVSAIASLVYSINPNLSAQEVKRILINSATEYITQRQTTPGGANENLAHPIPIVNAKEALKLAQKTVSQKVTVNEKMINIITPTVALTYTPSDINYKVVGINATIKSSTTQSNYTDFSIESSQSNLLIVPLDTTKRYHEINASISLEHLTTGNVITQQNQYLYSYSDLTIKTINNITLEKLPNVSLSINRLNSDLNTTTSSTDQNGTLKIYIDAGTYRLKGITSGYHESTKDISVQSDYSVNVNLTLTPTDTNKSKGSISGSIFDENGIPLQNALIKISGGALTNGYFTSTLSDENGYYTLTNLGQNASRDFNNTKIETFTMMVSKDGYVSQIRDSVVVLESNDRIENFHLNKENNLSESDYIYKNNFENNVNDWNTTGFWHVQDLNSTPIQNRNIQIGNVNLAPDDDSNGTLPKAYEGAKAFWYGQSSTGNYIGTETSQLYSGGRSTTPNSGTLISPPITIGDVNATLKFSSWWEIESINPNTTGFDLLEIYIVEEGKDYNGQCNDNNKSTWIDGYKDTIYNKWNASQWSNKQKNQLLNAEWLIKCGDGHKYTNNEPGDLVKKLNPAIDPSIENRERLPFSSGGFNRKPIWTIEDIDLSNYRGKTIRVKFKFNTIDELFNGFRGWIIDDFKIIDKANLNQ